MKYLISLFALLALVSCSYRPILDPNQRYRDVGKEQADVDINVCLADADEYLKQYKMAKIAKETGRKAAIGAGIGAVTNAISKGNLQSTLAGGLIGAGVGAIVGAAFSAGEDKITPDQIKQRYVNNCLASKGYNVLGWQ
jgi:hypothetical protein